jgi:hypothetical protein
VGSLALIINHRWFEEEHWGGHLTKKKLLAESCTGGVASLSRLFLDLQLILEEVYMLQQ